MVLLGGTAIAIVLLRDLFAAVMLSAIFSLLSAALFVLLDAVDVAFTEAAVGAGISTVLMLGTLALTSTREKASRHFQPVPFLVVLLTGGVLVYATLDMPRFGDPAAPIHHHVAPRYLKTSPQEVGVPNVVSAVLASYRGYDTYGETMVIFTAAAGVLLILGGRTKRSETDVEPPPEAS